MPHLALLLILGLPLVEIALLVIIGRAVGVLPILLMVIGTAVLGVVVLRRGSLAALRKAALGESIPLETAVSDTIGYALAGLLLITPGPLCDVLGLALLIPPLRRFVLGRHLAGTHVVVRSARQSDRPASRGDARRPRPLEPGTVIEGDFRRIDDEPRDPP